MKFCLVNFIVSLTKPNDFNFYRLVLDKVRMLSHLGVFAMKLGKVKSCLSKEDVGGMFPKQGFLEDLGDSAETAYFFKDLHTDYQLMKDVYCLKRIEKYVKVALQVNLDERKDVGKLVIERTLQVIGECLNNTIEPPNVFNHFHKILLSSASSNVLELITVLWDSLSHSDMLNRRLELEDSKNVSVFREVCKNLINIDRDIGMIIYKHTADIFNMYLHRVDFHQTKNMIDNLRQTELEHMEVVLCNTSEWDKIKELLSDLSHGLDDTTRDERRYFANIHSLVDSRRSSLQCVQRNFIIGMRSLNLIDLHRYSVDNLRMTKNCYRNAIECMEEVQQPLKDLNHILDLLHWICRSLTRRNQYNALQQVIYARDKIVDIHKLGTDRGHGIAAIKERLEKRETDIWNKAQADVQRVFVEIGNKISKTDKDVFDAEAKIKIKMYFAKRDLRTFFAKLIANAREPDQWEIQKYRGSVNRLGLKKDKLEELQGEYNNCNWDKCKMLVANVQNSYQTLLDSVKNSMEKEKHEISNCYKDFVNSLSLANTSDLKRDLHEAIGKLFKHNEQLLIYFDNRLTMLKRLLPNDDCLESVQKWKQDKELQIAIEMLVLDLTEILGYAAMFADNRLFIDSYSPVLTGKTLRNYLAHGDSLMDILPFDPSVAILANALRFIKEGRTLITNEKCLIGQRIVENHSELRRRYRASVDFINIQNKLFIAAKAGNLMMVRDYIAGGADVKACDVNKNTVAHFAAQGNQEGNVEVCKYCLDQLLCIDSENDFCQSPLYVAVRHGSVHIMKYVIEELQLRVNIINFNGMLMLNIPAKYGHNDLVKILLRNGANITATTGAHPFFDATEFGHPEVFLTLLAAFLEKRSVVDVGDCIEWTPLHYAVVLGHKDIVIDLLENGANVNAASKLRMTPLHLAAKHGHKDIAATLLDHNANIDRVTLHNKTPLHLAVEWNYPEVVKLLLERNANVHATDDQNFTALHYAAHVGNEQVVASLLDCKAIVDARIFDQCTALHIAAKFGNKGVVEVLLDHNVIVNAKDEDGEVPLHFAARHGVTKDVVALLERGSHANALGEYQKRPLHYAALNGNTEVIQALLDKNASINAMDEYMHTALHLACLNANNEAVLYLLARGANVNAHEVCGWTPLHMAIFYGHSDVVMTLLKNGADVNREDHNDNRPLHLALYFGRDKAALSILMDGEAEVDFADKQMMTPLHFAAKYGHTEIFHAVLEKKANINAVNEIHWTPLHFAAQQGNKIIIGALIKRDANVNAVDKYNQTPLHLAASLDQKEVVNALLEGKANVNAVNQNLNTPLHLAAANGRKEIVNFLLEGNTIVDHLNKDNFTPLHLAALNGHKEIVNVLLEGKANVNAVNKNYSSPLLHCAVHEVHKEVANAFLEGMPYDDAVNEGAFALLCLAARACHLDNSNVLLEGEANLDASNMDNCTPLHLAASKGHREVCSVLLNKGADVLARNSHDTVLHNAVGSEDAEIVQMILDRIKDILIPGTELLYEAINAKDGEGDTPLMWAAEMGLVNVAKLLVEQADVDVHAVNGSGMTVLHYAAKRGLLELVKWLVEEKCAVVGAADFNGKTPLDLALKKNHVEIVEYLSKYHSTN